jgi:hypothetical protein
MTSSPGFEDRHEGVVEHLLAAGRDADLLGRVVQAVLAQVLRGDRLAQVARALDGRVLRQPQVDRLVGGGSTWAGGWKSGSPAVMAMTSTPAR